MYSLLQNSGLPEMKEWSDPNSLNMDSNSPVEPGIAVRFLEIVGLANMVAVSLHPLLSTCTGTDTGYK